jgi:hypothetical protein
MESLNLIIYLADMYWFSHSPFVYFVCAPMLFFCVASFPTPSAFLVAPSYTTSPVLENTLSFDTLIRPLCTSFELRCFAMLHRFLRPPHSSLLRLTPRRLSWKTRSHLPFGSFVCAPMLFFCVASFPTPCAFLVTPRHLSWLGKDALVWHSRLPFVYLLCASIYFCVASFSTASAFLVATSYTTSPILLGKVLDPSFKEERRLFLLRKVLNPSQMSRELLRKRQNNCWILNSVLPTH